MRTPDAIIVLSAGIKQDAAGRWVSTDLTAEDNQHGAPGGTLRVLAAAALAQRYPHATIVASGGKGFDVPPGTPEDRPLLCDIIRDELIDAGVPLERIVLEGNSSTTYQQLLELEHLAAVRGWKLLAIVSNTWHLPRIGAIIEAKIPQLSGFADLISAEDVLVEADSIRWKSFLDEAYSSRFVADRKASEEQGVADIRNGTYRFR